MHQQDFFYLRTSWWNLNCPASWRHQLWQVVPPCQHFLHHSSDQCTRRQHAHLSIMPVNINTIPIWWAGHIQLVSFSERDLQPCYRPAESSSKQIKHAWTSKSRCSGLPDNYRQVWWSRVGTEVCRTGNGSLWHSHDLWFDISCQK